MNIADEIKRVPVKGKVTAKDRQDAVISALKHLGYDTRGVSFDSTNQGFVALLNEVEQAGRNEELLTYTAACIAWRDKNGWSFNARAIGATEKAFIDKLLDAAEQEGQEGQGLDLLSEEGMTEAIKQCQQALLPDCRITDLCHFKGKITNSNSNGSVFVPASRQSSLPYLFSGSLQRIRPLPPDLAGGAGSVAIIKVLCGEGTDSADPAFVSAIENAYASLPPVTVERELNHIDARLRQIVIPWTWSRPSSSPQHPSQPDDPDGTDKTGCDGYDYVTLIPMYSAGAARIIHEEVRVIQQARKETRAAWEAAQKEHKKDPSKPAPGQAPERHKYIKTLPNGIGGANTQNVTAHHAVADTLYFPCEIREDRSIRIALSVFHRGFRPRLNKTLVGQYSKKLGDGGEYRSDRITEKSIDIHLKLGLRDIAKDVLNQVRDCMTACDSHAAKDVIQQRLNDGLQAAEDPVTHALINGHLNDDALTALADRIVHDMKALTDKGKHFIVDPTGLITRNMRQALLEQFSREARHVLPAY